jgi:hypothetical protein
MNGEKFYAMKWKFSTDRNTVRKFIHIWLSNAKGLKHYG